MSVPFRIGYCVGCGEQAYVKNSRGGLLGAMPGTKLFYIVLYDDSGCECRVGTLMACAKCDPLKFDIKEIKKTLFDNPYISGVTGTEGEWDILPYARIEIVREFKGGQY